VNDRFLPIGGVSFRTPPSFRDEVGANVRASLARPHPRLHRFVADPACGPIALVGGGPSLKDTIGELRSFGGDVMACGTAHDWLVRNGVTPRYAIVGDHHPIIGMYLETVSPLTTYFVATQCDTSVFDLLRGQRVFMWHCMHPGQDEAFGAALDGMTVDGGCTIGLRALSLAFMMGRTDIHFFGFDSCLGTSDAAYAFEEFENPTIDRDEVAINVRLGRDGPGDKVYRCLGWHVAQAQDFAQMLARAGGRLRPTFHGGGLLADMTG
jgi:uncharacterized Rossmann fold enzyme